MHKLLTCGVLALLLSSASTLAAPDTVPAPSAKAQAQVVLRQGNEALTQGRAAEAIEKFLEAYRLFPSPKIHYNLGQAHGLLSGHEAQAFEEMTSFLEQATTADPALRAAAREELARLRTKVALITVHAEPLDAELVLDDVVVGGVATGRPRALAAGTYRMAVKKAQAISPVQIVELVPGEARDVKFQLAPPPEPLPLVPAARIANDHPAPGVALAAPTPAAERPIWSLRRKAGIGLLGLGVASIVFGVVEHVAYFERARDFRDAGCGTDDLSVGARCKDLHGRFISARNWLIVGYVGAAMLGGAGGYLLWFAPTGAQPGAASPASGMTVNLQRRF